MTPTPPDPAEQGFPPRQQPFWPPAEVNRTMIPMREAAPNGEQVYAVIFDSPDIRFVSYWTRSAFERWRDMMTALLDAKAGGGLSVADLQDLKALREGAPFPFEQP